MNATWMEMQPFVHYWFYVHMGETKQKGVVGFGHKILDQKT